MIGSLLLLALAQTPVPEVGRDALEALDFPELAFVEPEVQEHDILGVTVFHLHDSTLPLVDVELIMAGGTASLGREALAPLSALPILLRRGGTMSRSPSEVETAIDLLGLQVGVGGGGGGTSVTLNGLSHQIGPALSLLAEMLTEPGFDADALETWRSGELERLRQQRNNPGSRAFSEFNRLIYGDSPTGWAIEEADLAPGSLTPEGLSEVHARVACRDRLYVGLAGDLSWEGAEPLLRTFVEAWPECPEAPTPAPPTEAPGRPGVFLVPIETSQSTIVAAHTAATRLEDTPEYFASRIADFVLGSGGLSSRVVSRMRARTGLVYQAASVWTAPLRQEALVGAFAATGAENTVRATRELVSVLDDFRDAPPSATEIESAVQTMESAFVFAFDTPARIVARRLAYRLQGLPDDWLSRYLQGLRSVGPEEVEAIVRNTIDPERLTILIAGDPRRFDDGVEDLGTVYVQTPDGEYVFRSQGAPPDGSPQSPR